MEFVYFYKKDRTNIPVIYGTTSDYSFLIRKDSLIKKIQKEYPETEDNLFALVQEIEFKVPFV